MSHLSLMPFEALIDYLSSHGFADQLDTIMRIKCLSSSGSPHHQTAPDLSDECNEKFMNTWWEVCWPFSKKNPSHPPQCLYVADSLRDALRLRPHIDVTFWPDKPKSFAKYLKSDEDEDENWSECDEHWLEEPHPILQ